MKIAIDAMGGDLAPAEIVKGVLQAARDLPEIGFLLAGNKPVLETELSRSGSARVKNIDLIHTTQVIEMNESPVDALRRKRDSSLMKCIRLVRHKEADGFVSAGNTGAAVAGATIAFGLLENVKRPGIAVPLPTQSGQSYLIDVGANIHCNPVHLLQYGIMTSTYCKHMGKIKNPRVGLLNIGVEDSKGNELVKQSLDLFKKVPLNFTGNIEGQEIFKGECNVIVCEGFMGNVILKSTEGGGELFLESLALEMEQEKAHIKDMEPLMRIFRRIKERVDYSAYGGAPLLGVNGVCIICHGRSDAQAIFNAIKVAVGFVRQKINEEITRELSQIHLSWLDLLKSWRTYR